VVAFQCLPEAGEQNTPLFFVGRRPTENKGCSV